jgi:hypothetical protein
MTEHVDGVELVKELRLIHAVLQGSVSPDSDGVWTGRTCEEKMMILRAVDLQFHLIGNELLSRDETKFVNCGSSYEELHDLALSDDKMLKLYHRLTVTQD